MKLDEWLLSVLEVDDSTEELLSSKILEETYKLRNPRISNELLGGFTTLRYLMEHLPKRVMKEISQ